MMTTKLKHGDILEKGYTKLILVAALSEIKPITRPTFDRRLEDQNWIKPHYELLTKLGFFGAEATVRLSWVVKKGKYKVQFEII